MKVCFAYSNRSEFSILSPFIEYFQEKIDTDKIDLSKKIKNIHDDKNLGKIYIQCYEKFSISKYDYVCLVGDRRELPFIALAAFFLDIKVVHIGAGEFMKIIPTYDQIIRPVVSILSYFQISLSKEAKSHVSHLFNGIQYLKPKAYNLGNPVFKGINLKKLIRPIKENYDLVLIHPQSLSRKETKNDLIKLRRYLKKKKTVFISGNKDRNFDLIESFYNEMKRERKNYVFYNSLPKKEYFTFIKYCDKFYTNTSGMSEIEFLNKDCLVKIGLRNKGRSKHELNDKAPELLLSLLKKDFRKNTNSFNKRRNQP
ncbi:MAG TPA: UDP-N-acetylglucosamine 2-epimerase [Candidatus Nitrosotalea sp.]|nr:UDP-N-acetylglucosamine 2-epimerase [Candidatus Nitrosotalea sp.]